MPTRPGRPLVPRADAFSDLNPRDRDYLVQRLVKAVVNERYPIVYTIGPVAANVRRITFQVSDIDKRTANGRFLVTIHWLSSGTAPTVSTVSGSLVSGRDYLTDADGKVVLDFSGDPTTTLTMLAAATIGRANVPDVPIPWS